MCFIGMNLPGRMLFPFSIVWVVGCTACTAGIRTLNRMMNSEIRDEILLGTLLKADNLTKGERPQT
jgi:hypothetical protein